MMIFCRKIVINNTSFLEKKGPLLLACNHPNSFLDAVVLDMLFEQPVWALARGDVFKNRWIARILLALKMFPVYRVSEGAENLNGNYDTFEKCRAIFQRNGIVLIFSEGRCINEWQLRPLKKGTARLALSAWDENIPLEVLPVGINYSSFRLFGKNIFINFGSLITEQNIPADTSEGLRIQAFNQKLQSSLAPLVYELPKDDIHARHEQLSVKTGLAKRMLLALPAALGWLIHLPLYLPLQRFVFRKTAHNDHYDSVMAALLLFLYPCYLLLITFLFYMITGSILSFWLLLIVPFTAWSFVQLKQQIDH
jgi:1-acyl-sn-glycerol-3-phosphate acyltransferase